MRSKKAELSDTDDSDDSSEDEPLYNASQSSTKARGANGATSSSKDGTYRIRGVLKPNRMTQYTAQSLYEQIQDGDIELNPDYQRDVVWTDNKQINLIDSIFRNFYIPPIIFSVTIEDDGTEQRVCIDGKQRLTSIQRFLSGEIPHRDSITGERYWFTAVSNAKRKSLPAKLKNSFKNKQITCVEYSDLPAELEREVFQRVQMGVALTTAERMQALSGPWPDLVREIDSEYCKNGIFANIVVDLSRSRDFMDVAQAIFCIDQLPNHPHPSPTQIDRWLKKKEPPSHQTHQRIRDTFRVFKLLVDDEKLKKPFKLKGVARVAPVEIIMIAVLIAMYKDSYSLPQLSQSVEILRKGIREVHDDVRMNTKVVKTTVSILTNRHKFADVTQTPDLPVASQVRSGPMAVDHHSSSTKNGGMVRTQSGAVKRKRVENDHEEEEVEEYISKPKMKAPKSTPATSKQLPPNAPPPSTSMSKSPTVVNMRELGEALPSARSMTEKRHSISSQSSTSRLPSYASRPIPSQTILDAKDMAAGIVGPRRGSGSAIPFSGTQPPSTQPTSQQFRAPEYHSSISRDANTRGSDSRTMGSTAGSSNINLETALTGQNYSAPPYPTPPPVAPVAPVAAFSNTSSVVQESAPNPTPVSPVLVSGSAGGGDRRWSDASDRHHLPASSTSRDDSRYPNRGHESSRGRGRDRGWDRDWVRGRGTDSEYHKDSSRYPHPPPPKDPPRHPRGAPSGKRGYSSTYDPR